MDEHRLKLQEKRSGRSPSKPGTFQRAARVLVLLSVAGVMPAFLMRCDKAALNVQRGFFFGLGEQVSEMLLTAVEVEGD